MQSKKHLLIVITAILTLVFVAVPLLSRTHITNAYVIAQSGATNTPGLPPTVGLEIETISDNLPITSDVRYQVGIGDTLDDIAATFDVDLTCLKQVNTIADDENVIFPGDELIISINCGPYAGVNYVPFPRAIEQGGGGSTYTVRVGDTLSDIAIAFDVSQISLAELNGLENENQIFVGQVLEIPLDAPPYGQVPPLDGTVLGQGGAEGDIIYTIQPRDTLDTIGAFYNAAPQCIADSNNIENANEITPRTTIVISQACSPYVGANVAGGRILPLEGAPTVAATTVITATPRATLLATATLGSAAPIATPTAESLTGQGGGTEGEPGNLLEELQALSDAVSSD